MTTGVKAGISLFLLVSSLPAVAEVAWAPYFGGREDLAVACRGLDDTYDCVKAVESAFLPMIKSATRVGSRLTLVRPGGGRTVFQDGWKSSDQATYYSLLTYEELLEAFIVHVQERDGSYCLLVGDKNGRSQRLDGFPFLSPDGTRFFTLMASENSQPSGLKVWHITSGQWTLVASATPHKGVRSGKWEGSERISLELDESGPKWNFILGRDGRWEYRIQEPDKIPPAILWMRPIFSLEIGTPQELSGSIAFMNQRPAKYGVWGEFLELEYGRASHGYAVGMRSDSITGGGIKLAYQHLKNTPLSGASGARYLGPVMEVRMAYGKLELGIMRRLNEVDSRDWLFTASLGVTTFD